MNKAMKLQPADALVLNLPSGAPEEERQRLLELYAAALRWYATCDSPQAADRERLHDLAGLLEATIPPPCP